LAIAAVASIGVTATEMILLRLMAMPRRRHAVIDDERH